MFQKPTRDLLLEEEETSVDHTDNEHIDTVVGPSVHVEGDFASEGNILVKGTVTGDVKTSQSLTVEEGARISANIEAANALISGDIQGNMVVADRLELTESARIVGDIDCSVLVIHAGALLVGKINMHGLDVGKKNTVKKRFGRIKNKFVGNSEESNTDDESENV